ncbi:hypothetical protein ACW4TU_19025 [Streptomyces sp. QTS52]
MMTAMGGSSVGGLDAFDLVGGGVRALRQVGLAQPEFPAPVMDGLAQRHGQAGFSVNPVVLGVGIEVFADQLAVAAGSPFPVIHRVSLRSRLQRSCSAAAWCSASHSR